MEKTIEEKNAFITSATITNDEHGVLSAYLHLDYGNSAMQSFGGYVLYLPSEYVDHNNGGNYAGLFI